MNTNRRKAIEEIKAKIESLFEDLGEAKEELQQILDEEQSAYDNLPESLQEGEKGEAMNTAIDNITSAIDELENVELDEAMRYLELAAE